MWSFGLLFLASLILSIVFFLLAIKEKNRTKNLMKGITFLAISYTLWLFVADMSDSNFFIIFSFWIIAMALIYVFLLLLSDKLNLKKYQYISKIVVIPLSLLFFIGGVFSVNNADDVNKETPKKKEVRSNTDYYSSDSSDTGYYDNSTDESSSTDEYNDGDSTSADDTENISTIDEDTLKDTLEEASSDYRYKVKSVKGVFDTEPYLVNITLNGTENLSSRLTFKSFEHDIADVLKVMKKNGYQDYEKISINVKYPMTDQDGNETDSYVIKSDFTPASIKKINFKEFYPGNLKDVANSWWVQPTLKKYE
ncbi:hypothetical protein FHK07_12150 [Listeria monocytogenes]|nr:hypothetical protein [Listeria monocytogenes]EJM6842227.1 hypothetical protein [Listeria monocytogenes]